MLTITAGGGKSPALFLGVRLVADSCALRTSGDDRKTKFNTRAQSGRGNFMGRLGADIIIKQ